MASYTVKCAETNLKRDGRFNIYARACHPGARCFRSWGARAAHSPPLLVRRAQSGAAWDCFTLEHFSNFQFVKVSVSFTSPIWDPLCSSTLVGRVGAALSNTGRRVIAV